MFHSVKTRLVVLYFLLMLLTICLFDAVILMRYRHHLINEHIDSMQTECRDIGSRLLESSEIDTNGMYKYMEGTYKYLSSSVVIYRGDGSVAVTFPEELLANQVGTVGMASEDLDTVLSGESFSSQSELMLDGVNVVVVNVAEPILDESGNVAYAVLLTTELSNLDLEAFSLMKFLWIPSLIVCAFGVVMIIILASRITKPIEEINALSKKIANGEYGDRLTAYGDDEISQLVVSMNTMADALTKVDENHKTFVSNVSHDLRSPLTSIGGYIKAVLDGTIKGDDVKKYLAIASSETDRMERMVSNLLDLSRMESGKARKKPKERFDICEAMRLALISFEGRIEKLNLEVEVELPDKPIYVLAVKDDIQRVLVNLIDNAIKFTNVNGKLTLKCWVAEKKAYVKVADNGMGMDPSELEKIWDRFYQTDKSRPSTRTGTGLGLAIVKRIIREHGENIDVNSKLGEGTEFVFSLQIG